MYVCPIPGADTATIMWHAGIHYGLAALVVTVGAIFLGLAVHAYRASALTSQPNDEASSGRAEAPNVMP